MKIIAFAGAGNTGKNTAAAALSHFWQTEELAFSTPLYEMAAIALNCSIEDVDTLKRKGEYNTRSLLENLGDTLRKTLRHDILIIHVVEALRALEDSQDTPALAVITDLRTEEEASWVRAMQGLVIHVTRPEEASSSTHKTNRPLTLAQDDGYIINAGSKEDLEQAAIIQVSAWLKGKKQVAA